MCKLVATSFPQALLIYLVWSGNGDQSRAPYLDTACFSEEFKCIGIKRGPESWDLQQAINRFNILWHLKDRTEALLQIGHLLFYDRQHLICLHWLRPIMLPRPQQALVISDLHPRVRFGLGNLVDLLINPESLFRFDRETCGGVSLGLDLFD